MRLETILPVLNAVPDYQTFLSVDEMHARTARLAAAYPAVVSVRTVGHSRQGDPIEVLQIGRGVRQALLFAMPHPNEPIGSMTLEYLTRRLAEDAALRESLGYTWHIIKCIDPDGARLNEGWFKGPFSVTNYARHYYRPPAHEQVEWTFPTDYKTLHFDAPLPETQVLMGLIEQIKPDFIFSLHNSGFGGVYFYLSEDVPPLYPAFYDLVRSQDLPLHLGEPEMPYAAIYDKAIYQLPAITESYDFMEKQTGADPAEMMRTGCSSHEYARRFCKAFFLVCEAPYFYSPSIQDTAPSDKIRRDAILEMVNDSRQYLEFLQAQYAQVAADLTVASPFRSAIEEMLRTYPVHLTAQENWARSDPRTVAIATVAEKFDNQVISDFYHNLSLGMFVRMLETQIAATGRRTALETVLHTVKAFFEQRCADLESRLDYTVIPIQKLVRVQLGSALLVADYLNRRQTSESSTG